MIELREVCDVLKNWRPLDKFVLMRFGRTAHDANVLFLFYSSYDFDHFSNLHVQVLQF